MANNIDSASSEGLPNGLSMTAADFVRNFGRVRHIEEDTVMYVTHHGRTTHAFMTVRKLLKMQRRDNSDNIGSISLEVILDCVPVSVIVLTNDLTVICANKTAEALLCNNEDKLEGKCLFEFVPNLGNSLVAGYTNRAVKSKERTTFELPRIFGPESWTRFDVYPFAKYSVLTIFDISEDVARHRMADHRKAIENAVAVHEGVSFVCLTKRGHIEHTGSSFTELVKLPPEKMLHVLFSDIVERSDRVAFREALDRTLCDGVTRRYKTNLLSNDGSVIETTMSIAPLESLYGIEGALLLIVKC